MFPREIVDLFVKEANDQNISLAPFLFVNQTFRLAARKAILHHVTLTIYASGPLSHNNRIKLFRDVLQGGDQEVLESIKRLTVRILVDGPGSEDFPGLRADSIAEVLTILAKAPTLQVLSICGTRPMEFNKLLYLSPTAIDALIAIRSSPSMRELTISDISFIPRSLLTGTSLNHDNLSVLKLLGYTHFIRHETRLPPEPTSVHPIKYPCFNGEDDNSSPPGPSPSSRDGIERLSSPPAYPLLQKLTHLDVFDGKQLWNVLCEGHSNFRFDALTTLEVGPLKGNNFPNPGVFAFKILERAPIVETLCLRHWLWEPANPTFLRNNLCTFTQIHTLHLVHRHTRGKIHQQIVGFLRCLECCGSLPHIHTLTTSFEWPNFTATAELSHLEETIDTLDTETWPHIQDVLAKTTPALCKFGISFLFTKVATFSMAYPSGFVCIPVTMEDILPVKNVMDKWTFRADTIEFEYKLLRDESSGEGVCSFG